MSFSVATIGIGGFKAFVFISISLTTKPCVFVCLYTNEDLARYVSPYILLECWTRIFGSKHLFKTIQQFRN